jgi:hypothetical protein
MLRFGDAGDQRFATLDFPSGPTLSRVRCIASFGFVDNNMVADAICSASAALPAIPE